MRYAPAMVLAGLIAATMTVLPAATLAEHQFVPAARPLPSKPKPQVCPEIYQPVCAKKKGNPKSYSNECRARMDGATDIMLGHCSPGQ